MPPRMRTQSAGRHVAESRGGGTGEQVGRGGRGRGPRRGNDERVDELNGQGNDQEDGANGNVRRESMWLVQGNVGNQNGNVVNENVQENIRNVLVNGTTPIRMLSQEVVVSMSWNDFKFMMIEEFCPSHEMQKWKLSCGITPWSGLAMLYILIGFMSWLGSFFPSMDRWVFLGEGKSVCGVGLWSGMRCDSKDECCLRMKISSTGVIGKFGLQSATQLGRVR
ncbi:hypothetical protein Tco_0278028 [Tanacetum coccineum]